MQVRKVQGKKVQVAKAQIEVVGMTTCDRIGAKIRHPYMDMAQIPYKYRTVSATWHSEYSDTVAIQTTS